MTVASEPRVSADEFKRAFRLHPAGVAIVTADAGDGPVAMTVSSLFSVSVDPPTLVFSASAMASSTPTIQRAETVVAHMVASDNVDLAKLCATSGSVRFGDEVGSSRLPTGEPYYPGANAWLRGRVVNRIDVHGSVLIVVEVLEAASRDGSAETDALPLVYHGRRWFAIDDEALLREKVFPYHAIYGRIEDDELS
ncbi:flavin reductase family protein [Nocardioides sp. NPDC127503]|uniref:flavin reductase family protein n=1 Tax=Nocardioides sp. NPDC127503 TaxID=3154516 RepID=UPI0033175389